MKKIAAMFALAGLVFAGEASANDWTTSQDVDAERAKLTILTLPVGHSVFEVSGKGSITCLAVAPNWNDLANGDIPRVVLLGGQIATKNKCVVDVELERQTTVVFVIENDDGRDHTYEVRGIH